jgi:hypothetical protein
MTTAPGRSTPELCGNCHSVLAEDDTFCGSCGNRVPSRSDVPLTVPVAVESRSVATAESAVPDLLTDGPDLLAGMPDLTGTHPKLTGRTWAGTAEAPDSPARPGNDAYAHAIEASVGQATPNSTYIGMRLQYDKEPESSFDPLENFRFLKQLFFRAIVYWLVAFFGSVVGGIFFAVVSAVAGTNVAVTGYSICGSLTGITLFFMYILIPLPVLLSEWKFSVDGKGAAAPIAFDHIAWTLQQRETPLDSLQVRRLRLPGAGSRDYMELRQGLFRGYIGCFPYGRDLYVGWTFYFQLSLLRWVFMFLARIWHTLSNRIGTTIRVTDFTA